MEWIHDRNGVREFFGCGALEPGEPVHRHDFHPVPPVLGACLQPGPEGLLRPALDHVQQAGRAGAVMDRGEVNDDGDVLVPAAGVPPYMLINANDPHPVETVPVIDQHAPAFGQDSLVRGIPAHSQPLGDPGDREVLADHSFQRPAQPAAGEFRPRLGSFGHVLPPHMPAPAATVAADAHQQSGRPPSEGFMTQSPGYRVPGNALASALVAPVIGLNNTAGQDSTLRADILPGHFKAEPVEAAECGQVRALEGSVKHEGLAVEESRSRQSDSLPRPSPQLNNSPPELLTRQRCLHSQF